MSLSQSTLGFVSITWSAIRITKIMLKLLLGLPMREVKPREWAIGLVFSSHCRIHDGKNQELLWKGWERILSLRRGGHEAHGQYPAHSHVDFSIWEEMILYVPE